MKNKRFTFTIPSELLVKLIKQANEEKRSISYVIGHIIEEHYKIFELRKKEREENKNG